MKNDQLIDELNDILNLLNQQLNSLQASYNKLQVALTGVLRIANDDGPLLTNLQGDPEHLKSYLIRLCSALSESTTQSYEDLRKRIERLIDSHSNDRKS